MVNQLLQDALEADDDEDVEFRFTGRYVASFNPFTPKFLRSTLPFLNLEMSTYANRGSSLTSKAKWQTV